MLDWIKDKFASLVIGRSQGAIARALAQALMGALGVYGLDQGSAMVVSAALVGFGASVIQSLLEKRKSVPLSEPAPKGMKAAEVVFVPKDEAPNAPGVVQVNTSPIASGLPPAKQ